MSARNVKLGTLLGLNNRLEPMQLGTALPDRSRATYLYRADNVDLNDRGHLKRRRGSTRKASASVHSLWGDGAEGYAVIDGVLSHLSGSSLAQVPLVADLPPDPVSYTRAPTGRVYWSNGIQIGCLSGMQALALVPDAPNPAPTAIAVAGGLPAGKYQVAFTTLTDEGESASTTPLQVDLADGGGITFAGLQADTRIYVTGPNGEVFNEIARGDYLSLSNVGAPCATLLLQPMPAGHSLCVHGGSLMLAAGDTLYVSEPYHYGLMNPSRNFLRFRSPITVIAPCSDGVYVCADRTYWLAGDVLDTPAVPVLAFGGLRGSLVAMDDGGTAVAWQSPQGIVVGKPGGEVGTPQAKALAFGDAEAGATLFRKRDGSAHLIAVRLSAGEPTEAAGSYLTAQHQKETVL